jgi:hypothetical protein
VFATPVPADGELFVRTRSALHNFRSRWPRPVSLLLLLPFVAQRPIDLRDRLRAASELVTTPPSRRDAEAGW